MKRIKLNKGKYALVDNEDFDKLNLRKWYAHNSTHNLAYAESNLPRRKNQPRLKLRMHRVILNAQESQEIDHINRNGLDNRKINLRFCTHSENASNRGRFRNTKNKHKHIMWNEKKKLYVIVIKRNKKIVLGTTRKLLKDAIKLRDTYLLNNNL